MHLFQWLKSVIVKEVPATWKIIWGKNRVSVSVLFMIFIQCTGLLDPSGPGDTTADVKIEFAVDRRGIATPSSPYILSGTVSSSEDLDSIVISFRDSDGNQYDADVTLVISGALSTYDFEDNAVELEVSSSDCNGTYAVNVRAYSAGEFESVTIDVEVDGATDCSTGRDPVLTLGTLSGSLSVTPGSPVELTGSYSCTDCETPVSFAVTVEDSLGTVVTDNTVTADVTPETGEYTVTVEATSGACNGEYMVVVEVESGTLTETVTETVTVSDAFDCNMQTGDLEISKILILGAQKSSVTLTSVKGTG